MRTGRHPERMPAFLYGVRMGAGLEEWVLFSQRSKKNRVCMGGIISYPSLQIAMPEVAEPSSSWVDSAPQPDSRAALFRL